MAKKRRTFSREFKTKVALKALKENLTIAQLAKKYSLHPNQISAGKKQSKDDLLEVFGTGQQTDENEELVSTLYEEIGLLEVQLDWLKKNLKNSVSEMRAVIEKNERLSIKEQYKLLVELTTMRRKWNL